MAAAAICVWAATGVWGAMATRVSISDARRGIIPAATIWAGGSAVAVLLLTAAATADAWRLLLTAAIGAASVAALCEVIYRLWPQNQGWGDSRLIIATAILAGWWGVQWPWVALAAGSLAAWPAAFRAAARSGWSTPIRAGPWLSVGAAAVIAWRLAVAGPVPHG